MIEYHNKITALYSRLSVGDEDRDGGARLSSSRKRYGDIQTK